MPPEQMMRTDRETGEANLKWKANNCLPLCVSVRAVCVCHRMQSTRVGAQIDANLFVSVRLNRQLIAH